MPAFREDNCTILAGLFRTQTQGGWGAVPNGGNSGRYLHGNFDNAFPYGIRVGCINGYQITLSSAQAVTDFLPQGGTPAALTQSYIDPKGSISVLAGQLVAATISVNFDYSIGTYSGSTVSLGSLIIATGPLAGMSIDDLLIEANNVLGGCSTQYAPSTITNELNNFNQNFLDGKMNNGYLECPDLGREG